jgi:aldehyde:ferredoxin oxidoreductase
LWGKTTTQAEALIKAELGDQHIEVAQVGPAGENRSCLAAIMNMGNRANGRTGLGAVMGSKNLKAVAVRGSGKKIDLAAPKRVQLLARSAAGEIRANLGIYSLQQYGTASVVSGQHLTGTLPARNYNEGQFAQFEQISGEAMEDTILVRNDTCYACAVRCKRVVETEWAGRPVAPNSGGPEYETIGTFGSYCEVDDLRAIAYANMICNEYGLDTIGTGATIAWAMECYATGLLSEAQIGFPLPFGDAAAMTRMVDQIARREGFGAVLADGSARAAGRLGVGHEHLITVKGSEVPAHMPQAKRSLALIYAVNAFGPDHQSHEHDPSIETGAAETDLSRLRLLGFDHTLAPGSLDEEKVDYALKTQLFYSFLDSACLCQFVWGPAWQLYGPSETLDLIRAMTGWDDFDLEELLRVGERRINLMRLFNARAGLGPQDDTLPAKFFRPLQGSGPTAGVAIDRTEWERAKELYYERLGWNAPECRPSQARLAALGLAEFADER